MNGVEGYIAASESFDWIAFSPDLTRGQVIEALASESSWWEVLHGFALRKGFVHHEPLGDWWYEAAPGCECSECVPCWLVTRKQR